MRALLTIAVMITVAYGCAAKKHGPAVYKEAAVTDSERWRDTDDAVVQSLMESVRNPRTRGGGVTHVVLVWLKTPGDAAAINMIIRTSREFTAIPGVVSVRVGRPLPSTRPVVDSSFDVGLAMQFNDPAALAAYEVHPQHVKAVREVLRPLAAKIQVYDIREADMKEAGAATAPASK